MQIEIYSTPNCQYCDKAKAWFKEQGLEYTEYDVSIDSERKAEALALTDRMGVPVIRIHTENGMIDDVFYGWDEDNVKKVIDVGLARHRMP